MYLEYGTLDNSNGSCSRTSIRTQIYKHFLNLQQICNTTLYLKEFTGITYTLEFLFISVNIFHNFFATEPLQRQSYIWSTYICLQTLFPANKLADFNDFDYRIYQKVDGLVS